MTEVDTVRQPQVAQTKICSLYGKTFTWAIKSKIMGKKALEAAQVWVVQNSNRHLALTNPLMT